MPLKRKERRALSRCALPIRQNCCQVIMTGVLRRLYRCLLAEETVAYCHRVQALFHIEATEINMSRCGGDMENGPSPHVLFHISALRYQVFSGLGPRFSKRGVPQQWKTVSAALVNAAGFLREHPFHVADRTEHDGRRQ